MPLPIALLFPSLAPLWLVDCLCPTLPFTFPFTCPFDPLHLPDLIYITPLHILKTLGCLALLLLFYHAGFLPTIYLRATLPLPVARWVTCRRCPVCLRFLRYCPTFPIGVYCRCLFVVCGGF